MTLFLQYNVNNYIMDGVHHLWWPSVLSVSESVYWARIYWIQNPLLCIPGYTPVQVQLYNILWWTCVQVVNVWKMISMYRMLGWLVISSFTTTYLRTTYSLVKDVQKLKLSFNKFKMAIIISLQYCIEGSNTNYKLNVS